MPDPAGHEVGDTVLFFGCRRSNEDFIYEDEMNDFLRDGTLTAFPLAFSREVRALPVVVRSEVLTIALVSGRRPAPKFTCRTSWRSTRT